MARLLKVVKVLLGLGVVLIGGGLAFLLLAFPRSEPASNEVIERTPKRVARGRYLVEHVANCLDCHSERDWDRYGGPVVRGTEGQGAHLLVLRPAIKSANITPSALGDWTDGEIARAMTSGIGRDGAALHPFMPYDSYAHLEAADVKAVVSYLRELPSIENVVPKPKDNLAIRLLGRTLPKPYVAPEPVDRTDSVAYGGYLTAIAECSFCHGGSWTGGRTFRIPHSEQERESANISPHPSTRMGAWSREEFVGVFKSFAATDGIDVPEGQANTVMPWARYAGMTEQDLGAIYDYLRTVEPLTPKAPE